MRSPRKKTSTKLRKQLPPNGARLTAVKRPLEDTSAKYTSPSSGPNTESIFDPEVEPLVTQLLSGDPSLVYPSDMNPIPQSGHEPPFHLGKTRHDRKVIETLMEIHEEKMNGRNMPLDEKTYLALKAGDTNPSSPPAAHAPSPSFWEQPLENILTEYQTHSAPEAEQRLITLRIAQKEANSRAAAAATAAAQRAQKAEAESWVAASGVHSWYEAATRNAAREMRLGPACCCNRYRWPVDGAPLSAREREQRDRAAWRAVVGLDGLHDELLDEEADRQETDEEYSL